MGAELDVEVVGVGGSSRGFICIIFLARLGGGGRSSFALAPPDNVRFLVITGEAGGEAFKAAGGRAKEFSISCIALSLGVGPVELTGVGGSLVRGIVSRQLLAGNSKGEVHPGKEEETETSLRLPEPCLPNTDSGFSHLKFNELRTCPKFPRTTGTTGTRRRVSCACIPHCDRLTRP